PGRPGGTWCGHAPDERVWPRCCAVLVALAGVLAFLSAGPAPLAFAGSLSGVGWSVSSTAPGAGGASYTFTFTTASAADLDTVTVKVPPGTGGSPAVGAVSPASVAAGGAVSLSGHTLTYTFTNTSVPAGTAVSIEITGLANTTTAGTYT